MQQINWTTVQRKVNDLLPQEVNPRKINNKQMSDLKKSLTKFGLAEIPAIDFNGKILSGHMRCKALKLLGRGEEIIDVRLPNRKLTDKEAKEYLIGSNKLGGEFDFELLKSFEVDILLDVGFDELELSKFWDQDKEIIEDDFNIEKELKKIINPVTKLGNIIELGNHRILCGDSTKEENLKKLFGGEQASMVYSDPIYNINVNYSGGIGGKQNYGGNVNDSRTYEEYYKFIEDSLSAALSISSENLHVYYFCDQIYIGLIQEIYRKLSIQNRRVCLWLKNSQNCVPLVAWNKAYEPAVYGTIGRPFLNSSETKNNEVMNRELGTGNELLDQVENMFDIWTAKRLSSKEYTHSTSKPNNLHEKAIRRCTKPNDIILDSFLGSGSTLLCAEQMGRRVYGLELEPVFCDLIIKRWEKQTGKKAKYIN
jgi:DNA modification methylase